MMKLAPQHTIVDAVVRIDQLDPSLLESLLATHEASGLRVLPAPLEPAFADQIGASDMVKIVEVLRRFCSHVVIDTPAYFNDVVLGLVEVSDDVLLVAGMDIPNIKNVKIGLQTLRLLNTPMEKLRLILNRANSKVKLDIGGVERTLQVTAESLIPSDVVVPQSVNKGCHSCTRIRRAASQSRFGPCGHARSRPTKRLVVSGPDPVVASNSFVTRRLHMSLYQRLSEVQGGDSQPAVAGGAAVRLPT